MIKKEDLNRQQREGFDLWRSFGLSEQAALDALIEDGTVTLSPHDQLVRSFRIIGLSEKAAETAARGRGGSPFGIASSSPTPVSDLRYSGNDGDGSPWPETGLPWHQRMQRELDRQGREIIKIAEAQREHRRQEAEVQVNRDRNRLGLPPVDLRQWD
jgi:hypothetical protein